MIIDAYLLLSEGQSLADGTAVSQNILDLKAGGDALGDELYFVGLCTEAAAGGTSVTVTLETSDDSEFGEYDTLYTSDAALTASLTQGYKLFAVRIPRSCKRYLRATLTALGTFTSGSVDLFLTAADHHSYENFE